MATIVGADPHKRVLSAVALDERGGLATGEQRTSRPPTTA